MCQSHLSPANTHTTSLLFMLPRSKGSNVVTPESEAVLHVKMCWILLAIRCTAACSIIACICDVHLTISTSKRRGKSHHAPYRCTNAHNAKQCFIILEDMDIRTHLTTKNSLTSPVLADVSPALTMAGAAAAVAAQRVSRLVVTNGAVVRANTTYGWWPVCCGYCCCCGC